MYYLFIIGRSLALLFPRSVCYFVARFLSIFKFYLSKKDREAVIFNLSPLVVDKRKLRQCARQVFINFSYYIVDFFRYAKLNRDFIKKYIRISGLEYLKQCMSQKRGVILLSAHLGNYELGAAVISLLGYPLYALALNHKDRRLTIFFHQQRKHVGVISIPTGMALKRCLSLLSKGNFLGFLGDRDFTNASRLKFAIHSRYALIPKGAAYFALKGGAYILPLFLVRENKKFYHFIFDKPIVPDDTLNTEEAIMQKWVSVLERYIRQYPEQWYMFEKYWVE